MTSEPPVDKKAEREPVVESGTESRSTGTKLNSRLLFFLTKAQTFCFSSFHFCIISFPYFDTFPPSLLSRHSQRDVPSTSTGSTSRTTLIRLFFSSEKHERRRSPTSTRLWREWSSYRRRYRTVILLSSSIITSKDGNDGTLLHGQPSAGHSFNHFIPIRNLLLFSNTNGSSSSFIRFDTE